MPRGPQLTREPKALSCTARMPKFTPLRERARVALATENTAEIRKIKREIVDAYKASGGSIADASERLGVNRMTLHRVARDLGIESDLNIDFERSSPGLLHAHARVAVETGDREAVDALKKQIADAFARAGPHGWRGAASDLCVSVWVLKKTVGMLDLSAEDVKRLDTKYSLLGERILVAQRANDATELRRIKLDIVNAFKGADGDLEAAAKSLGLASRRLRDIADSLGLRSALGIAEPNASSLLVARARVALESKNQAELDRVKREILEAFRQSGGMMTDAAERLNLGEAVLSRLIKELGMVAEIAEKFPSRGKERLITARIDGRKQTHTLAEWSRMLGIGRTTVIQRLKRGYTPEQALGTGDFRETRKNRTG